MPPQSNKRIGKRHGARVSLVLATISLIFLGMLMPHLDHFKQVNDH